MRKERKELIQAYVDVFQSREGQLILTDLRKKAPLLTEGIDANRPIDTNVLLVLEGRADVVKYIHKMAGKDPLEERETFARSE